jgi:hypothetical protein
MSPPTTTRTVVAPALAAILRTELAAVTRGALVDELKGAGAPGDLVELASSEVGLVNFYAAFRNTSLDWINVHRRAVTKILAKVRSAPSDDQAREAYVLMGKLPPIPHPGGRNLPAFNLLTPVTACLDPRERSPVINARDAVRRRLARLGLANATLVEQFAGLVNLLNQAGLDGAFALDTANDVSARLGTS